MRDASLAAVLHATLAETDRTPDAELLRRFVAGSDDTAFELLLRRHADLVWTVCRGILRGDHQAAEDAFQATFLVLAQKAGSVAKSDSLGAWLFGVARHAALRVRTKAAAREWEPLPTDAAAAMPSPGASAEMAEWAALVAEEVDRLPDRYRAPVILCFYRGLTHAQAALELGWAVGTVASRVARAKNRLRDRLSRRGIALGASIAAVVATPLAGGARPGLLRLCVHSAMDSRLVPAHLLSLTREVFTHMNRISRKWLVATPLVAMSLTIGGVLGIGLADQSPTASADTQQAAADTHFATPNREQPVAKVTEPVPAEKQTAASALQRALSQKNLERIAHAILSYQAEHGHLPTDVLDKTGKPLLSWRVVILPYLDQRNIYQRFKLDEPWDSENNEMWGHILVKTYMAGLSTPTWTNGFGLTTVKRFTGPNTLHQPEKAIDINKTPDGRANTLLLAEVGEPVPWAKPDDTVITPAAPDKPFVPKTPPVWTGPYTNVVNVAFADGRALSLKPDLSPQTVASLIYWNHGMVPPNREELLARIPAAQQTDEIERLLKTLANSADELVKLSKEQIGLRAELARPGRQPDDIAVDLAKEVLRLEEQLRAVKGNVGFLKDQIEKAKKGK